MFNGIADSVYVFKTDILYTFSTEYITYKTRIFVNSFSVLESKHILAFISRYRIFTFIKYCGIAM